MCSRIPYSKKGFVPLLWLFYKKLAVTNRALLFLMAHCGADLWHQDISIAPAIVGLRVSVLFVMFFVGGNA